ncbi:glycosyl hydrolase family 28-related protein [Actomonas aquatica]|uniref:Glycosyl hydrolase family 28-related protein n=1 Tax=Actomonas aquatica TaxID=2866162 RepID=A0ABZ1C374_9BACT|nr:glycosyl hydrolase family 28-related protein [Opitutus sp. WL0086]WRQ86156.1 glycosyl hydrolase family 28-related protein [Opitutus sp. WL0086]
MVSPRWLVGVVLVCVLGSVAVRAGASYYGEAPADPAAVVLRPGAFGAVGDGVADDTAALQAAVNAVQEQTVRGVVLVEQGRYRLTDTVHVWAGIRLIGYGPERPVLVLGEATPGFDEAESRYLLHYTSYRPEEGGEIRDANPGTFYSAFSNIDVEIGAGNLGAVGIRSHWAQHGFIAHARFTLTSGKAAVEEVGNTIFDCEFIGGDYGLLTGKPSPSWPFTLLDARFSGQRVAAIRTEEAGMTIVRGHFADVPTVVTINPERSEELFVQDSRFERVSGPAIVVSEVANARTQVNLQNVVCEAVPELVRLRETGKVVAGLYPEDPYMVERFSHGLHLAGVGAEPEIKTVLEARPVAELPELPTSDLPAVPAVATWFNVKDAGAVGDGVTDDTAAIRAAIVAHRTVFFPAGRYVVSDTLTLREDSVLVGLSPITTQIALRDHARAFWGEGADERDPAEVTGWAARFPVDHGTGAPKALIESARGGAAILSGLGVDPGDNPRAVAVLWRAGEHSLVDDVKFLGGHGTYLPDGTAVPAYNEFRTADGNPRRAWDRQYASLWVTDGGGGTFHDLWTASPYAAAGMVVSDTRTPGRLYAMSSEHHVRAEVVVRRAANWSFYALQFEEERLEGPAALPLEIADSENLLFVNTYVYRVMSTYSPFPTGIQISDSSNVRFRGIHAYSPSKFTADATVRDVGTGAVVWSREIAWLDVEVSAQDEAEVVEVTPHTVVAAGFNNADGLVSDAVGNVLWVDARWQRIWRWEAASGRVRLLRDEPLEPVALAVAANGEVLVVTRVGTVYAFDPERPEQAITVLAPEPAAARPGATAWVPSSRWRDAHDFLERTMVAAPWHYVSPDGSIFIPAEDAFVQAGSFHSNYSTIDLIRCYGLTPVVDGRPTAVADEFGQRTFLFETHDAAGVLGAPRLLVEEGEATAITGPDGRVYVAAGVIFVYEPDGTEVRRIVLPQRPTSLAFGGKDGRVLVVGARDKVYAVEVRVE